MGSPYKRTRKRSIPAGATIVTKRGKELAEWTGKDGRLHRAKLTDDGQKIEVESKAYYIKYRDENGIQQAENSGASDKDTARQLLQAREKRVAAIKGGIVDPLQEGFTQAAKRPIGEHIDDFKRYLVDKGSSESHVSGTIMQVREAIEWVGVEYFSALTRDQVNRFIGHLRTSTAEKAKHGKQTRSARTVNSYLVSIKSFASWMLDSRRCEVNPLIGIKKLTETNDKRHERRALTSEEFTRLFEAAYNSPDAVQGIDGQSRATIYLTAALTGLRRKELASLTRPDFRLDDSEPAVRIQGAYSKNKKTDEIPLHPALVDRLRAYFDQTVPDDGQPVFPLRYPGGGIRATSRMMKHDCKAAGIQYKTDKGYVDFHALRVFFITSLCRGNVGLAMAQKAARHSDPKLTSNVYSKVSLEEKSVAIGTINFDRGHQEGTTRGTKQTANPGKMGHFLTVPKNPSVGDGQKEAFCNPLKSNELAQKKPLVETNGKARPAGLEPATYGLEVRCSIH
jgi:integrase